MCIWLSMICSCMKIRDDDVRKCEYSGYAVDYISCHWHTAWVVDQHDVLLALIITVDGRKKNNHEAAVIELTIKRQ